MGRLGANQIAREVHQDKPSWWSSDEWSTPGSVIAPLVERYGPFALDVCASERNHKAEKYYTREQNGIVQRWTGTWWCNPPYSNPKMWVEKAVEETRGSIWGSHLDRRRLPSDDQRHWNRGIMLLPAAVDTNWFHDLVLPHADIEFIRGRIRFLDWKGTPIGSPTAGNIFAFFPKGWT